MWPQYSGDPEKDWDAYCRHQDYLHGMLPRCIECNQPIEDDMCWDFGDGPICDECAEKYRKFTEDLME